MQVARNYPLCGVCGAKMVKNGRTSAGRTRWRCRACGASSVQRRGDVTRRAQLDRFIDWVLGSASQRSLGGTGRSFRASTAWCWNIEIPQPRVTGEVLDSVMLDGTYLQGWCLLIAFSGDHVLGWQWCDRESQPAWIALLKRLPAPGMVVVDGGSGVAAALSQCWPHTPVQRCYFHIFRTVTRHLTMHPRLEAGKQLRALTRALMKVTDLDQARAWIVEYLAWETRWDQFLKHRSYPSTHKQRPGWLGAHQQWWYTHRELRTCRALFRGLLRRNELFTWLTLDKPRLPRTTSPLEGGPNKAIKDLLRVHRGLPQHHAKRGIEWLLNTWSQFPHEPWSLTRPHHWQPTRPQRPITQEPDRPQPGTAFSWEDGNRIHKGWAGRWRP